MNDRLIQGIAVSVCVACLVASGALAAKISRERQENDLVVSLEESRGMPPHVALVTAALGTFRGLAVDALWIRADRLQYAGQYFEAQTLSQWITALQPRFPRVWAFQATNLAYNISVTTSVPEERWGWINRAMELLRTRAIPLNPKDPQLPMELGWIYFNKIGAKLDREHWYYKTKLAREFRELFGDPAGGGTTRQVIERFSVIASAADSVDDLRGDRDVVDALALLAKHGAAPNEAFVRMLGRTMLYGASVDARIRFGAGLPEGSNGPLIAALQADTRLQRVVFQKIVPCLQKKILIDRYRMRPAFMLELMERFGPLDWAHPHAHGIYWLEESIAISLENRHRERFNELTLVRIRLGNIQYLMRSGRVEFDAFGAGRLEVLPDPRFIDAYEIGMNHALKMIRSDEGLFAAEFGRATEDDLLTGYESFLRQATVFSYLYGDEEKAAECFEKLRKIASAADREGDPLYSGGIQQFMTLKMADVMEIDISNLRQFLDAMIQRALIDGLAKGRPDTYARFVDIANTAYERTYGKKGGPAVHVNKEGRLAPFPDIVATSFEATMKQQSTSIMVRARIWAWAPSLLRERAWPKIGEMLAIQAEAAGLDPAKAFPIPPSLKKTSGDGPTVLDSSEDAAKP